MKRTMIWKQVIFFLLLFLILGAGLYKSRELLQETDAEPVDQSWRLEVSDAVSQIEQGQKVESPYPYLLFDLSGKVTGKSGDLSAREGMTFAVNDFFQENDKFLQKAASDAYDRKITFAISQQGVTTGYVVFFHKATQTEQVQLRNQKQRIFVPIQISMLLIVLLALGDVLYLKKRVFYPIQQISESAKAIIREDYTKEVLRVYEGTVAENEIGDLIYSFELMRDELKEKQISEKKLRQSEQELISCISHDLQTPLSSIKAYGEGLRDGIAKTEEEQKRYVGIILKKTNTLIDMIKDLLEYSNARINQLSMSYEETYFYPFMESLCEELRIYVEQRGITFQTQLERSEGIVRFDKKRMTEVLYNLVENSMKYMDKEQPEIIIIMRRIKQYYEVSVVDNGMGIQSDEIMYVFDKFYRSEKSRNQEIKGSGLGLSICQYIVKEHQGEIRCESRANKGTKIIFTIPMV